MDQVLQYIDDHADEYVARVQELCRQPSIAAQNVGMVETARMVTDMLRQIGAEARTVPTAGHPVVFGQIDGIMTVGAGRRIKALMVRAAGVTGADVVNNPKIA